MTQEALPMWTIYRNVTYLGPDTYVAVLNHVTGSIEPTGQVIEASTLDDVRGKLPQGLVCMARHPGDHPSVIETWF